jgi:acyl-coenzyme A thioesterase PaaI-like protein
MIDEALVEIFLVLSYEEFGNTIMMDLNDTTDYQYCFACGSLNPYGLHLHFRLDGSTVVADFQPREEFQGFPGVVHGGIIATVLDEALNRTSMITDQPAWTLTGRLEIRYRRPVPYGPLLRVRAELGQQRGRMVQATGKVTLADDESAVLAEAQGTFMALSAEMLDDVMKNYPGMRALFEHGDKK